MLLNLRDYITCLLCHDYTQRESVERNMEEDQECSFFHHPRVLTPRIDLPIYLRERAADEGLLQSSFIAG